MKLSILLLFTFSLFSINFVYSEWCTYESQIKECIIANANWSVKSIEDFVCIMWNKEDIAFQVTLDMEFKELDKEMDDYVDQLEENKTKYFWISREKTFIDWINDLHYKRNYFYKWFKDKCWRNLIDKVASCTESKSVSTKKSKKFFIESDCMLLVNKKLNIFEDVTNSILLLNKLQVKTDEKKVYDKWQRDNYNKLLDIMNINIWYIERIWKKTPSITWNPL